MQSSVAVTVSRPPSKQEVRGAEQLVVRERAGPSISPCTSVLSRRSSGSGALLLDLALEVVLDRLARGDPLLLRGAVLVGLRADGVVAPAQEVGQVGLGKAHEREEDRRRRAASRSPRGSRTRSPPANSSMISLTSARASGSRSFIRFGENCGSSRRRYFACSGGSTDNGISGTSLPIVDDVLRREHLGVLERPQHVVVRRHRDADPPEHAFRSRRDRTALACSSLVHRMRVVRRTPARSTSMRSSSVPVVAGVVGVHQCSLEIR